MSPSSTALTIKQNGQHVVFDEELVKQIGGDVCLTRLEGISDPIYGCGTREVSESLFLSPTDTLDWLPCPQHFSVAVCQRRHDPDRRAPCST